MPQPSDANNEPGIGDILTTQLAVLSCAVEALVVTHPRPEELHRIFDQLFGQVLAGVLSSGGATPAGAELAKRFAYKLFPRS